MSKQLLMIACVVLATPSYAAPKKSSSTPAPKPAARLFDFKGIPLGMTLAEFRSKPHPDGGASRVMCTGEKIPVTSDYSSEPADVKIWDEVERSLGVQKCIWVSNDLGPILGDRPKGLELAGSGYGTIEYSFSFMSDPLDGALKLYRFNGVSNRNAADEVIAALTEKWGPPKLVKDTVQNKMGANFDQLTAIWDNSISSILVQDRWTKIDNMAIIVTEKRLSAIYESAKKAKKAATPNRI